MGPSKKGKPDGVMGKDLRVPGCPDRRNEGENPGEGLIAPTSDNVHYVKLTARFCFFRGVLIHFRVSTSLQDLRAFSIVPTRLLLQLGCPPCVARRLPCRDPTTENLSLTRSHRGTPAGARIRPPRRSAPRRNPGAERARPGLSPEASAPRRSWGPPPGAGCPVRSSRRG